MKKSRLTEPGKNVRFDPNLGLNLTFFQAKINSPIIRFEPGKMYRLTEPGKNARFDPNLDSNRTILQV